MPRLPDEELAALYFDRHVNWQDRGVVASLRDFEWYQGNNGAWAIQVVHRNGKWYMYCPIHGHGIGVLVADSPMGPYKDPIGKPLVWQREHWTTSTPRCMWTTTTGLYVLGQSQPLYGETQRRHGLLFGRHREDAAYRGLPGGPVVLSPWRLLLLGVCFHLLSRRDRLCHSKNPTGPWEYKGHIMGHTERTRGNHPGIIDYKGRSYCFGQNYDLYRLETDLHAERRSISLAEITYNADGTIQELPYFHECTLRPVANFNPYCRVEAETMAWGFGLKTGNNNPCSRHNSLFVRNIDDGEYIRLRSVDFVEGASTFKASASCHLYGGEIEIRSITKKDS